MSGVEEDKMARIQTEWRHAFASLVRAARLYAKSGAHRYAQGYLEFVQLSSAAIALYQIEEHYPLQPVMDVWPNEGWEKTLHDAAVAWAELSVCVPRHSADSDYAALSMQRMRSLQQTALQAPVSVTAETVHDEMRRGTGETRHDL